MTNDNIQLLFSKSGINLEKQVIQFLEEYNSHPGNNDFPWVIETNQFYLDPYEGVPRETDIVVSKKIDIYGDDSRYFLVRIFFECKFIAEDLKVGVFTRDCDRRKMRDLFYKSKGVYKYIDKNFDTSTHRVFKPEKVIYQGTENNNSKIKESIGIPGVKQILHAISSTRFSSPNPSLSLNLPVFITNDIHRIAYSDNDGSFGKLEAYSIFEVGYVDREGKMDYQIVECIDINMLQEYMKEVEFEIELISNKLATIVKPSIFVPKGNWEVYG